MGILQSLPVCFSHYEIEASLLSSVLIPILVIGNRLAEQLQKREQTQWMWDADVSPQWSDAAGSAQPQVSMAVTPLEWLSPASLGPCSPQGMSYYRKFNTVSARSTKK